LQIGNVAFLVQPAKNRLNNRVGCPVLPTAVFFGTPTPLKRSWRLPGADSERNGLDCGGVSGRVVALPGNTNAFYVMKIEKYLLLLLALFVLLILVRFFYR
jgi:hypothetical protein